MPYPKCRYFRHPDYGYVMAKSFRYTGGTIFTLCIVTDLWIIGPWHCVYNCMFKVIVCWHIILGGSGLQENIVHGQAPGMWPLKMDKPWFYLDKPEQTHFTKSSHIKVLAVNNFWFWWVRYHLRIVIHNPRINVELNMGRIKCKQYTSVYALRCIN